MREDDLRPAEPEPGLLQLRSPRLVEAAGLGWDRADKVASLLSALAGVASVGVAVWAA
ncbi:hypothetical protein AB0395_19185 [Streptosporangium sp. NPDC051023]|uniref:hypothetical protein n=1 Tax=Streptosporangium sp. NPDC051023 TaxID=3155410 RepID=UPI00344EA3D4